MVDVLLDANVFVSAFLNPDGPPARIVNTSLKRKFLLVISSALLQEVGEVLSSSRIKSKYKLSDEEITAYLKLISEQSRWVTPPGKLKISRDRDDDLILETAVTGRVKYLVSRDDDMKKDSKVITQMALSGVNIISVRKFLEKLNTDSL